MITKRIAFGAMLGLFVAVPAMAAYHHPGDPNPPQLAALAYPPEAGNTGLPAADYARLTADQNAGSHHLGYAIKGDKAYKRNYGN